MPTHLEIRQSELPHELCSELPLAFPEVALGADEPEAVHDPVREEERGSAGELGPGEGLPDEHGVGQHDAGDLPEPDRKDSTKFVAKLGQGQVGGLGVEERQVAQDRQATRTWWHSRPRPFETLVSTDGCQDNDEQCEGFTEHLVCLITTCADEI